MTLDEKITDALAKPTFDEQWEAMREIVKGPDFREFMCHPNVKKWLYRNTKAINAKGLPYG